MTIVRFFSMIIIGILTSFFIFPVGFVGLPESLNTKQIMAVLGIVFFVFNSVADRSFGLKRSTLLSAALAIIFSLWCFFCVTINHTNDYAYATYIRSFIIWLSSAYCLVCVMKAEHGRVSISLLIRYLLFVSVVQCLLAVLIDNISAIRLLVWNVFTLSQRAVEGGRLYGIGASLDSGGIRFATTLLLTSHFIVNDTSVKDSKVKLASYLLCFLFVSVIGSTISRTTLIGMALGLVYIAGNYGYTKYMLLTKTQIRFWGILLLILAIVSVYSIHFYSSSAVFREYVRFAFESFFNYFEKGTFSSNSTDILMNMWIWPSDSDGWIYGYGNFDNWYYHTDIGYCRFTMYCGLVGVFLFSIFFIYNAYAIKDKYIGGKVLSLMLLVVVFVIWIKVSTDIFQFFALLFLINGDFEQEDDSEEDHVTMIFE